MFCMFQNTRPLGVETKVVTKDCHFQILISEISIEKSYKMHTIPKLRVSNFCGKLIYVFTKFNVCSFT